MTDVVYLIPDELLIDFGYLATPPANNAPKYLYGPYDKSSCSHYVELPINENFIWCPVCTAEGERSHLRKRFTAPSQRYDMRAHYNFAAGTYVNNERELRDYYKRISEERTIRTGIEHNFVPIDPREAKDDLGVTEEGLEETYRRRRNRGLDQAKRVWL